MKIKNNLIFVTGLIFLVYVVFSIVFNIIVGEHGEIYSSLIEPIFFIVATFLMVRKWKTKGLISILIIIMVPLVLIIVFSFFEFGLTMVYKILTKPIIYRVKMYSFLGIILGCVFALIFNRIAIKSHRKNTSS